MYLRRVVSIFAALGWAALAQPAGAQGWGMVDTEGTGGAGAFVCAEPGDDWSDPPCLRLECSDTAPLHYEIALFGADATGLPEELAAEIRVDGQAAGLLLFAPAAALDGMAKLEAAFDPRLHGALVGMLRKGNRAEIALQHPAGARVAALSLRGSSRALGAVMDTCPMPEVPLNDPAAVVLNTIVRECGQLGGSVAMEPGFERREDLDGDGRDDVVIDYAAAVCSQMASLYCGSGGCTVGFFLARDEGFTRIYDGVIRGYSARPGGLLALDLHGTACGLYGFEACRKVFRIADDSFELVEELSGPAAEAAMAADRAASADEAVTVGNGAAQDPATADNAPVESAPESLAPEPKPRDLAPKATGGATGGVADPAPADPAAMTQGEEAAPDPAAPIPAPEPQPAPAAPAPDAPPARLEWMGDGGALILPEAGERLPDDLDPATPGHAPLSADAD
jgi:hypothetical protein